MIHATAYCRISFPMRSVPKNWLECSIGFAFLQFMILVSQFSRAIRKTALCAYYGWRRCFTHEQALNPYIFTLTASCKHGLLSCSMYGWTVETKKTRTPYVTGITHESYTSCGYYKEIRKEFQRKFCTKNLWNGNCIFAFRLNDGRWNCDCAGQVV